MSEAAKKRATYEDLRNVPEGMTGQIIDGELVVAPRPSRRHVYAASPLEVEVAAPYQFGRGGPGGWIILVEPEVRIGDHTLVPDLAGWRRERFPVSEDHNWISAVPDWICEVLSPDTIRMDRIKKMRIYREHRVPHVWLVDPINRTLEVFGLQQDGAWGSSGIHVEDDRVRIEPFGEVQIDLGNLWIE